MGLLAALVMGCASPRVTEVLHQTRFQNVAAADRNYFLSDRVSGLPLTAESLPADQQGEYFDVSWTPATIGCVQFEYRQVKLPNKVSSQTLIPAPGQRSTTFAVVGNEFRQGGTVSAWRVSLLQTGLVVAVKQSALW